MSFPAKSCGILTNMASNWYYKQSDQELGPYTFRGPVVMVRDQKRAAEVLVRLCYWNEWQRADSMVGLFHMARRNFATLLPVAALTCFFAWWLEAHTDEV